MQTTTLLILKSRDYYSTFFYIRFSDQRSNSKAIYTIKITLKLQHVYLKILSLTLNGSQTSLVQPGRRGGGWGRRTLPFFSFTGNCLWVCLGRSFQILHEHDKCVKQDHTLWDSFFHNWVGKLKRCGPTSTSLRIFRRVPLPPGSKGGCNLKPFTFDTYGHLSFITYFRYFNGHFVALINKPVRGILHQSVHGISLAKTL